MQLGAPNSASLLFYGPGPGVDDLVVFNSGGNATAVPWSHDAFAVPVVGRFDGANLRRDVVYLYRPGTEDSTTLIASSGELSIVAEVAQQTAYAYPLAAPYRGSGYPDDIVWLEPQADRVITWRLGAGVLELEEEAQVARGELGLVPGEHIPAIGDFDGDGRADIMWQGVGNQAAGFPEIEDVLWLSQSTPDQLVFATLPKAVGRGFRPFVGDFDGDGIDDIFWHRSWGMTSAGPSAWHTGPSYIWYFDADGCHDIAWFDAVGDALHVWRCMPGERDFDCGATAHAPPNAAPVGVHWGF